MKSRENLTSQQLEETVHPLRRLLNARQPTGGWIRAIRDALGMTNVQLARRVGRKSAQTVLDLQAREAVGTIQLNTLRELAEAMGCRVVYAVVPVKPLDQLRRERAEAVARNTLRRTGYSMKLENQGLGVREEERAFEREVDKLLTGSPRRLWE